MKILVANLGSTSLKYQLFDCGDAREVSLARGGFERVADYGEAIDRCLAELARGGFLGPGEALGAVGFKTVLDRDVSGCVEVDERVIAALEAASGIAPAHNPPYVCGLREFIGRMPGVPLVALFETAFFEWVPEAARAGANQRALGAEAVISTPDSPVKVLVIPTNEELVVAREVKRYLLTRPMAA